MLCACCTWHNKRKGAKGEDSPCRRKFTSAANLHQESSTPRHPTQISSSSIVIDSIEFEKDSKSCASSAIHYFLSLIQSSCSLPHSDEPQLPLLDKPAQDALHPLQSTLNISPVDGKRIHRDMRLRESFILRLLIRLVQR